MSRLQILFLCGLVFASSVQCASKQSLQPKAQALDVDVPTQSLQPNKASYFHFMMGKLAELDSQSGAALEHYRFASHFNESSDYLKMKQAEQLVSLGEISEAQRILAKLSLEDDPEFHLLASRVYAMEFNTERSQYHIDSAIRLYKSADDQMKVRETVLMKVALLSDSHRYDEAIKTLKDFISKNENDEIAYYFLGKILSIGNDFEAAIAAYKKAIELRPSFTTASKALGLQYELAGQTQDAIDAYQQALFSASEDIQLRSKLANLYLIEENYRQALEQLYFLHNMDSSNVQTKLRIALIHFKLADLDEAESMFHQLLQDESIAHDRIHFYLGALYEQKKDIDRAIRSYTLISPDSPYFEEARVQASFLWIEELSENSKGISNLAEAISFKPYSRELYLSLATFHERLKDLPEAIRVLDTAARLMKKDDSLLFVLGTMLDRAGDYEGGIVKMREVLEINPNHAHAMNHIGYVYTEKKINLDEAEELLVKAVQLEPQNAYIIDSLGWLYYQKNEFKKARQLLEQAKKIEPGEPVIIEHLADVYRKLGLHDLALEMYKKVVELSNSPKEEMESAPETRRRIMDKIAALGTSESLQ